MGDCVNIRKDPHLSCKTSVTGEQGRVPFFWSLPSTVNRPNNIHEKKLLDSDWLRAVQFKCNTSAKSVTLVQKV